MGQQQREEEKNATVLEVVTEWANGTSIHGLPYVFNPDYTLWHKVFWIALFLLSISLMFWQIAALASDFNSFSLNTSTNDQFPIALDFPEITICNTQSIQQSKVDATGISSPINLEQVQQISQTAENLILETFFNGRELNVSQVWAANLTEFGLCYRFNAQSLVTDNPILNQIEFAGIIEGLFLRVNLNQADYYTGSQDFTLAAGLLVFVSQPGSQVVLGSPFVSCAPGQFQFISLSEERIVRETRYPWRQCDRTNAPLYTQQLCRSECYNGLVENACNCSVMGVPGASLDFCTETCQEVDFTNFGECECNLPPCQETIYGTDYSAAAIPQTTLANLPFDFDVLENMTASEIEDNIVDIQINFAAIRSRTTMQTRAMTFTQFVANIGGQMGLFAGISAISIFELVGELALLRLFPRLWGQRRLYGIGSKP